MNLCSLRDSTQCFSLNSSLTRIADEALVAQKQRLLLFENENSSHIINLRNLLYIHAIDEFSRVTSMRYLYFLSLRSMMSRWVEYGVSPWVISLACTEWIDPSQKMAEKLDLGLHALCHLLTAKHQSCCNDWIYKNADRRGSLRIGLQARCQLFMVEKASGLLLKTPKSRCRAWNTDGCFLACA